mmetsp:Transcript_2122/g.4066  ORF Transcript_2122/g.4066 Transcript_2122/m.4066 type:complete len:81 (-) Transcript_2122:296-538(-)
MSFITNWIQSMMLNPVENATRNAQDIINCENQRQQILAKKVWDRANWIRQGFGDIPTEATASNTNEIIGDKTTFKEGKNF